MRLLTAMMGTRDALKTYPSPTLPFTLRVPAVLCCKNCGPSVYMRKANARKIVWGVRLCYMDGVVFHPRCVHTLPLL